MKPKIELLNRMVVKLNDCIPRRNVTLSYLNQNQNP